jgi:cyclopropane-fatty-acyl-phospholipid synthase
VDAFAVETGEWPVRTYAADCRAFHAVPAMAARLFPRTPPEQRPERVRDLLAGLSGPVTARWRWAVGVRA